MSSDDTDPRLASRRQSLKTIGRFAAMTAPAMLVLLEHDTAVAASEDAKGANSEGNDKGYNVHTGRHSHA